MALNLKRMVKAVFSAVFMDEIWAENMISQPIRYLCQQVQYLTLPTWHYQYLTLPFQNAVFKFFKLTHEKSCWELPLWRFSATFSLPYFFKSLFCNTSFLLSSIRDSPQIDHRLRGKWSQSIMELFPLATSRYFMFMYFLLSHWVPAAWHRAEVSWGRSCRPSSPPPESNVGSPGSAFQWHGSVRIRVQYSLENSQ